MLNGDWWSNLDTRKEWLWFKSIWMHERDREREREIRYVCKQWTIFDHSMENGGFGKTLELNHCSRHWEEAWIQSNWNGKSFCLPLFIAKQSTSDDRHGNYAVWYQNEIFSSLFVTFSVRVIRVWCELKFLLKLRFLVELRW